MTPDLPEAEIAALRAAIDSNNVEGVKALLSSNQVLHQAPLGYAADGALTWVAECRVPWEPPGPARLAMAEWMIENGSDVNQNGGGPLCRAALNGDRIPMMELLVAHGADVNAVWHGSFPTIFAPCEAMDPDALRWLLEHGADPNCSATPQHGTALDYLIGAYIRSPEILSECIEMMLAAGGVTRYKEPAVLDILRGNLESLSARIDADSGLIEKQFPELDFGATGSRTLVLTGATLLHVAAEFQSVEAARLLLDRGADANARAAIDEDGVGGQTALFHAATQRNAGGFAVSQLLLERGADLTVRVNLPGYYERPDEVVDCTPLGYAVRYPGAENATVKLLRDHGGQE